MLQRRGALTPGLLLILFGAWLLAQNLGVPLPGLDMLWPALPLLFGLGLLLQFFLGGRKDEGLVFSGVAAALVGAFFFEFTLGRLRWGDMDRYWPVFVLIGGLASRSGSSTPPSAACSSRRASASSWAWSPSPSPSTSPVRRSSSR